MAYEESYTDTFDESKDFAKSSGDVGILDLEGRWTAPTGLRSFGIPLRWKLIGGYFHLYDVDKLSLGFDSFFKYEVSLEPGRHILIVEYPTLLAIYHCTFEVDFEAGQTYEITDRSDRHPVFLNRLKRGTLFTTRLDKFPPQECTK